MVEKKIFVYIAILILLVILLFAVIETIRTPVVPSGKITAYFHLYSSPVKEQLEQVFLKFSREYPEVELVYYIEPYLDMRRKKIDFLSNNQLSEDHVVISSSTAADIRDGSEISPGLWTGTDWKLFYNSEVLSQLNISEEDLQEISQLRFMDFIKTLSPGLKSNQTLFAVSSRYYIQWLSWLQHLELEQNSGRMPKSFALSEWQDSIDLFNELVESGYINPDHGDINEASTALRMFKGEALFSLSTDSIYSIFLPGDRKYIKQLNFPGSLKQGWNVGSGFYLTMKKPEKVTRNANAAAHAFFEYLRSDEVIDQMLKTTGVKLHPARTRGMLIEIPTISDQVGNAELYEIIDYIRN